MTAFAEAQGSIKKPLLWMGAGGAIFLLAAAIVFPDLNRARFHDSGSSAGYSVQEQAFAPVTRAKPETVAAYVSQPNATLRVHSDALKMAAGAPQSPAVAPERRIVRTSSIEMVVEHPADVIGKITALAESAGGYLESSESGGQNATSGALTIRVPTARFEDVRASIRKLGVRVETEKVDARDVTRQYVDEDANLRNLRAEEAQYLTMLKQATTVKDLLAVSEQLSQVRGEIERQQAEFNALSRQTETVAITIALRTEAEAQVLGLNWRPLYQLKLALRDGLESLATYATSMTAIIFYLPAILLWVGTISLAAVGGWKLVRWAGKHWFGSSEAAARG